jgi:hypothetical protein
VCLCVCVSARVHACISRRLCDDYLSLDYFVIKTKFVSYYNNNVVIIMKYLMPCL